MHPAHRPGEEERHARVRAISNGNNGRRLAHTQRRPRPIPVHSNAPRHHPTDPMQHVSHHTTGRDLPTRVCVATGPRADTPASPNASSSAVVGIANLLDQQGFGASLSVARPPPSSHHQADHGPAEAAPWARRPPVVAACAPAASAGAGGRIPRCVGRRRHHRPG